MKVPVVDNQECVDCGACLDLCPDVFTKNEDLGMIRVADLASYPEDCVDEAIANCPADCIYWDE